MRILIADDDSVSRTILARTIESLGHTVFCAENGQTAFCRFKSERPDVVLCDWRMPGCDGPELCRRIRTIDSHTSPYFILMTGLSAPNDFLSGMEAGADDYLVKPLDRNHLAARLIAAERVTKLHQKLYAAAHTDAATGLLNRLALNQALRGLRERIEETGGGVTLALCDIDFFKRYNDRYGHLAGDVALRRVAQLLADFVGPHGSAYRYGGEEFCLLIESLPPPATDLLETIRRSLDALAIPHEASDFGHVTISIGAASFRTGDSKTTDALLNEADTALYQAKAFGRNRIAPRAFERLANRS